MLPTVNGSHDYLDAVEPDPLDPFSPGLFVPAWDQGRVAVGNGDADSHWVHDDMEVTAVAFDDGRGRDIQVVVAANLYMIFGVDADAIRERVAERVGRRKAASSRSRSPPTTTTTALTRRSTSTTRGTT